MDTIVKQTLASWRADTPEQNFNRLVEAEQLTEQIAGSEETTQQDKLRLARIHF